MAVGEHPIIDVFRDTDTNAVVTAAAPARANARFYIKALAISASAAPGTAIQAELRRGAAEIVPIELPAAAFAPVLWSIDGMGIQGNINEAVNLVVPAAGASVTVSAVLMGYYKAE